MVPVTDWARGVVEQATRDGVSLATAESLTGGMLAARIVDVPGASAVFRGGVVSYATDTKVSVLGVSQSRIDEVGPVDREVALAMARGCAQLLSADVGVATTGVAGPGPADGHEAGTVWIAVVYGGVERSELFTFSGDRDDVRAAATSAALRLIYRVLAEPSGRSV